MGRTCCLSVWTHFQTLIVVPTAPSGTARTFSQHWTGCIICRRADSELDVWKPTRRRVDMAVGCVCFGSL